VPLVRPGQAASFLRRHLARQRPGAGIDLARVLRALVCQRPLLQVPAPHAQPLAGATATGVRRAAGARATA
jgi:hypothetical protein